MGMGVRVVWKWGVTAKGYGNFFWSDENVLKLDCGD